MSEVLHAEQIPSSIKARTIYQVEIEWDHEDYDVSLSISDRVLKFKGSDGLRIDR